MSTSAVNTLVSSLHDAAQYPENLIELGRSDHERQASMAMLEAEQSRIFGKLKDFSVYFLDLAEHLDDFKLHHADSEEKMGSMIRNGFHSGEKDPVCRFVFIHAPDSRARLNISKKMFMELLSYHQVMPRFLDFCLSFGFQVQPLHFIFSGFRYELRLEEWQQGPRIPARGRSGKDFQLCYNMRSVEVKTYKARAPWSIRQTAIYQSMDLEEWRSTWIVLKGNLEIKKRIEGAATKPRGRVSMRLNASKAEKSIASALEAHLLICEWSTEGWRWYISWLEQQCQALTEYAAHVDVSEEDPGSEMHQKDSGDAPPSPVDVQKLPKHTILRRTTTMLSQLARVAKYSKIVEKAKKVAQSRRVLSFKQIRFEDLQEVQHVLEQANEASLVIDLNLEIMRKLDSFFHELIASLSFADATTKQETATEVKRFSRTLGNLSGELEMQQKRLSTIVKLVGERKTLLNRLLDHQNTLSNQNFAEEARTATERMEHLTEEMKLVAQRTEKDTVSMRVITVVTMIFLPGTFVSTMFSTDILKFSEGDPSPVHEVYSHRALVYWLAFTIPLMVVTLAATCVYSILVNKRRKPSFKLLSTPEKIV